jgi:hypothetical protein
MAKQVELSYDYFVLDTVLYAKSWTSHNDFHHYLLEHSSRPNGRGSYESVHGLLIHQE